MSFEIRGRVTTTGKVPSHPGGPTSALWEEALGRAEAGLDVEGLLVALSIVTCKTIEQLRVELEQRSELSALV